MSTVDIVQLLLGLRTRGFGSITVDAALLCPGGSCILVYNTSLSLEWDSEGRLTAVELEGVDEAGRRRRFRRELEWDSEGRLVAVGPWREV